jgi:excisionase family DNA binding protein
MAQDEEELLTVDEVAKHMRVDEKTVRRWINRGELVAIDIGRGYRISRASLNDFKQRRQTDKRKKE